MTGVCASGIELMNTHETNVPIAKSSSPVSFSKVTGIVPFDPSRRLASTRVRLAEAFLPSPRTAILRQSWSGLRDFVKGVADTRSEAREESNARGLRRGGKM